MFGSGVFASMPACVALAAFLLGTGWSSAQAEALSEVVKLSLPTNEFIQRADFYYIKPPTPAKAVLVLCPGKNGNGEGWIKEAAWAKFAEEHHLLLAGISFASKSNYPLSCYSDARSVSGEMVLEGIKQAGGEGLPILMYGFSAGARFTASFVERYPDKVFTWCACGVGQWIPPVKESKPPAGIVATGEYDAGCFWASLQYFQQGRQLGREWTWVSAPKVGHQRSKELEEFVRGYFAVHLAQPKGEESTLKFEWRDIDTKKPLTDAAVQDNPIFATSVPGDSLGAVWEELHHP
jgi:pimeloyl-ACP methyl ester carboxylesterase